MKQFYKCIKCDENDPCILSMMLASDKPLDCPFNSYSTKSANWGKCDSKGKPDATEQVRNK